MRQKAGDSWVFCVPIPAMLSSLDSSSSSSDSGSPSSVRKQHAEVKNKLRQFAWERDKQLVAVGCAKLADISKKATALKEQTRKHCMMEQEFKHKAKIFNADIRTKCEQLSLKLQQSQAKHATSTNEEFP